MLANRVDVANLPAHRHRRHAGDARACRRAGRALTTVDGAVLQRRLMIHGLVQGVGFRASLAREARCRGLAGWVRNRSDGSVEAVVAGEPSAVEDLIRWAGRGPPAARVVRVDVEPASGELQGFETRPTS